MPGGVRPAGAIGIDLTDVFAVLEEEGVRKFEASWNERSTAMRPADSEGNSSAARKPAVRRRFQLSR